MDETEQENKPAKAKPGASEDPLHGVTLKAMLERLVDYLGWDEMSDRIGIRCFSIDPSIGSSLKFLRKTPWARNKVEQLYLRYDFSGSEGEAPATGEALPVDDSNTEVDRGSAESSQQ